MSDQQIIDGLNVEKIALDQAYVQEIQKCLELRKQHLMKDKYIEDLNKQLQGLLKEKEELNAKIFQLESKASYPDGKAEFIE